LCEVVSLRRRRLLHGPFVHWRRRVVRRRTVRPCLRVGRRERGAVGLARSPHPASAPIRLRPHGAYLTPYLTTIAHPPLPLLFDSCVLEWRTAQLRRPLSFNVAANHSSMVDDVFGLFCVMASSTFGMTNLVLNPPPRGNNLPVGDAAFVRTCGRVLALGKAFVGAVAYRSGLGGRSRAAQWRRPPPGQGSCRRLVPRRLSRCPRPPGVLAMPACGGSVGTGRELCRRRRVTLSRRCLGRLVGRRRPVGLGSRQKRATSGGACGFRGPSPAHPPRGAPRSGVFGVGPGPRRQRVGRRVVHGLPAVAATAARRLRQRSARSRARGCSVNDPLRRRANAPVGALRTHVLCVDFGGMDRRVASLHWRFVVGSPLLLFLFDTTGKRPTVLENQGWLRRSCWGRR
jgi:hypothetical protein